VLYFTVDVCTVGRLRALYVARAPMQRPRSLGARREPARRPFYAVEVQPGHRRNRKPLRQDARRRLANPAGPLPHQPVPLSLGDVEHTPKSATVEFRLERPVVCAAHRPRQLKNTALRQHDHPVRHITTRRYSIELDKEPTSERLELDFAFPFQVPNCQVRYELPGAIVAPGADHLPGSGLSSTPCVTSWICSMTTTG